MGKSHSHHKEKADGPGSTWILGIQAEPVGDQCLLGGRKTLSRATDATVQRSLGSDNKGSCRIQGPGSTAAALLIYKHSGPRRRPSVVLRTVHCTGASELSDGPALPDAHLLHRQELHRLSKPNHSPAA